MSLKKRKMTHFVRKGLSMTQGADADAMCPAVPQGEVSAEPSWHHLLVTSVWGDFHWSCLTGCFGGKNTTIYLLAHVNAECVNILGNVHNTIHIRPQPQWEDFITEPRRWWWVDFLTTEHVQVQRPCLPCFQVLYWAQSGYWSPRLTECGTSSLALRGSGGESQPLLFFMTPHC